MNFSFLGDSPERERILLLSQAEYSTYYINPYVYTSISIPRTHPSTSTISHKIKLEFSSDSHARSSEARRDVRRSTPSNEYISINVPRVSFESSASRNMKCHLLEHIARPTHTCLDRSKMSNPRQNGKFIITKTLREVYYCTVLLIIVHEIRSGRKNFSSILNIVARYWLIRLLFERHILQNFKVSLFFKHFNAFIIDTRLMLIPFFSSTGEKDSIIN